MRFLVLVLFFVSAPRRAHAFEITELCGIRITAPEKIHFSATESKWLCGEPGSPAWREIPVNQRKISLTNFLQSRGYQKPDFRVEEGALSVDAGEKSSVRKFTVEGAPAEWDWARRRHSTGSALNPARLDEDVTWARRMLQYRGYPCPKVEAEAYVDTGEVHLKVDPGEKQRFGPVQSQGASDMDPRILGRFTAFYPEDYFDLRLLELTSERILHEDLYLSTFYDVVCDENRHAQIVRRFVPSPPRLLTVGAGFDTENGPLARARWKRTRLTSKGDSFESTAFLSFRDLQLELKYRYHFPADPGSRWEFAPRVLVDRRDERQLRAVQYLLDPAMATSWELRGSRLALRFGPALSRTETERSLVSVPARVDTLRLAGSLHWTSHYFEYYAGDPREGYDFGVEGFTQFGRWLSDKTIHKLLFKHEMLFNLGGFDPPFLVLGWRGFEGSYFYNPRGDLRQEIAPSERFFLGGDEDIRGFGRQRLQGAGIGYLTAIYEGVELRFADLFPYRLQPFVFFDVARAGQLTETLSTPLYMAPGLGLRWASPVGTVRTTLARGFTTRRLPEDPEPNGQFFFSFGKEF